MHITIVIDTIIPVFAYGGTERVMWYLGQELTRRGHKVSYLAPKGSTCPFAEVVVIDPKRTLEEQVPDSTDVVHFNCYNPRPELLQRHGRQIAHIVTWHGNFLQGPLDQNSLFVSRQHAERHGSTHFVWNGMNWDDYPLPNLNAPDRMAKSIPSSGGGGRGPIFHFLGQAAWRQKNLRGAISVVEQVPGATLKVMGGRRLNLKHGLKLYLSRQADFMGMVGGELKFRTLEQSSGFIFPVRWHEPFGIAITESLYFGCPVFGTPYGSLPELVSPEVGYLTTSAANMAEHIRSDYHYSPQRCHEYARDVHNAARMTDAYLAKYELVLSGRTLNAAPLYPLQPDSKSLEWI